MTTRATSKKSTSRFKADPAATVLEVLATEGELAPQFRSKEEFERVVAQLTEPQLALYRKLEVHHLHQERRSLRDAWEFGKMVRQVSEDLATYGSNFIGTLARLLSLDESYLYKRQTFYIEFSQEQLTELMELKMSTTGAPLTWTHVVRVLDLEATERWQLLQKAAELGWTSNQLQAAVKTLKAERPSPRRGVTGRPTAVPATIEGKLAQATETLPVFRKRAQTWADPTVGILAALQGTEPERLRPSWIQDLTRAIADGEEVLEHVSVSVEQWKAGLAYLQKVLEKPAPGSRTTRVETASEESSEDELFSEDH